MERQKSPQTNNPLDLEYSRRRLLRQMAGLSLGLPLAPAGALSLIEKNPAQQEATQPHSRPAPLQLQQLYRRKTISFSML